jgi:hypothetical protein
VLLWVQMRDGRRLTSTSWNAHATFLLLSYVQLPFLLHEPELLTLPRIGLLMVSVYVETRSSDTQVGSPIDRM